MYRNQPIIFLLQVFYVCDSFFASQLAIPITNLTTHEKLVHKGRHDNFLATFVISTFTESREFDITRPNTSEKDYIAMIRAARLTWAAEIKHFYVLTADSKTERAVLSNQTLCQNLTHHYQREVNHVDPNVREQVYSCQGLRVLHSPICDLNVLDGGTDEYHCCRAEAAIRYYLNKAAVTSNYPKWFAMLDDDFYVRTHKLKGLLSLVDPNKPYTMTSDSRRWPLNSEQYTIRLREHSFGHLNRDCHVPCVHKSTWFAATLLSFGAVVKIAEEVRAGGLSHVCKVWDVYHDVGVGIFLWMHSIPLIKICCGPIHVSPEIYEQGVFYHHVGKTIEEDTKLQISFDLLAHRIWEIGARNRMEISKATKLETPNREKFVKWEFEEGIKAFTSPIPHFGFENSLYYKKKLFAESVSRQLTMNQNQNFLVIPRFNYSQSDCEVDRYFHYNWRSNNMRYPLHKSTTAEIKEYSEEFLYENEINSGFDNLVAMCMEYHVAVVNAPININNLSGFSGIDKRVMERI